MSVPLASSASVLPAHIAQSYLAFQALYIDQEVDDVAVREVVLGNLSVAHLVCLRYTAGSETLLGRTPARAPALWRGGCNDKGPATLLRHWVLLISWFSGRTMPAHPAG